jgi:tetratricopeptide (TPR) repeat protein
VFKRILAGSVVWLIAVPLATGQQMQQQVQDVQVGVPRQGGSAADKPTPENQKRGMQLLTAAEADAGGLQGGMRAYALLQIARAYERTNKVKALELLEGAFTATREMDDDGRLQTRASLQEDILKEMVPLAPERVDELLTQIDAGRRAAVLESLLTSFERNKQLDRAVEVIYRIAGDGEFPYGAAQRVLQAMPEEERAEQLPQMFNMALASFRDHPPQSGMMTQRGDLGFLLRAFWRQLPRDQVKAAIQEMLKQTEEAGQGDSGKGGTPVAFWSQKGSVSFSSMYQYRLFDLLPILRAVDEDEAERLLKKNQEVQALMKQYPEGMQSLTAPEPQRPAQRGGSRPGQGGGGGGGMGGSMMMVGSGPGAGGAGARMQEFQRMQKIMADAEKRPEQVITDLAFISDKGMRASGLVQIARSSWRQKPASARSALRQAIELAPDIEPEQQGMVFSAATGLYMKMEETDEAKKVIEKHLAAADKMYKADTNADDPNKALKAYWPSTNAYKNALRAAGEISPSWAMTLLKEVSDPEVKVTAEVALAGAWLKVPVGRTQTVTSKGGKTMMSISVED